jgi:hypothetical protein
LNSKPISHDKLFSGEKVPFEAKMKKALTNPLHRQKVNFKEENELSDDYDEEVKSVNMSYFVNKHEENNSMRTSRMSVLKSNNASQNKFYKNNLRSIAPFTNIRRLGRESFTPVLEM